MNEVLIHIITKMNLETILPSKGRQTKEGTIPFI